MSGLELQLQDVEQCQSLGARLAAACEPGTLIALRGPLGAGKTTLARGFLRGAGYQGAVKSPTYTLVEPYPVSRGVIYHLDLYRLSDPEELEWIGIRDILDEAAQCLVEWPERGAGVLPGADIEVELQPLAAARSATLSADTERGAAILRRLAGD